MILLILGLILWVAGHLWNRWFPSAYAGLGKAAYAVSAVMIIAAVILIVVGYRATEIFVLWPTYPALVGLNNLLMLLAFYVYMQTTTPRGTAYFLGNLKHPQLSGFCIWAVAHLLVNGDLASLILWGGLIAWAMAEVILITKQGEKFDRSKAFVKSPLLHLGISLVVFVVVAGIHTALGVNPFGG